MKRFTGTYLDLVLIAGMGFIPLLWFRDGYNAIAGFDFAVYLNPVDTLLKSFYLWSDRMAGGYDISHEISSIPYYFLFSFPVFLGASFYTAEKFVFIVIFALQGFSMYYMLRAFFERHTSARAIALTGAVLYSFNFPVMAHFGRGNMMALLTYGLLPLLLGLLHKGFTARDKGWKYIMLIAFLSFPISATKGHPADFVVLMGVTLFFVTFNLLTAKWERALHIFSFISKAGTACFLVNLWWIVPNIVYLRDFGLSNNDLVNEGFYNLQTLDYYSSGTSILNIFRNERLDLWFDMPPDALFNPELYKHPVFIAIGLLLPAAAFFSIIKHKGNKHILFFSLLGLIAVFMSKGSHEPFGKFFQWLFLNVPGFFFFRAPYRVFSSLYTFSTVPLLAYIAGGIAGKRSYRPCEKFQGFKITFHVLGNVSLGLFIFTFLTVSSAYAWPIFNGSHLRERGTLREPGVFQSIPKEYNLANEWLSGQGDNFKVYYPYEIYDANTDWGYNGPDPSFEILTAPKVVSRPGGTVYIRYQKPVESLNKVLWNWKYGDLGKVLTAYDIRYTLLHDDFNPWVMPSYNFNEYSRSLFEANGLALKRKIGPLAFYENKTQSQRIYGTNKSYILSGDESSFPVLSLAGFMDSPSLVFTKDIHPEELEKIIKNTDGIIFHDSNINDAVCAIFEKNYAAGFKDNKYRLNTEAGEYAIFLKGSLSERLYVNGKKITAERGNDGLLWKSMRKIRLEKGEQVIFSDVNIANDVKAIIIPADVFKKAKEQLTGMLDSEKKEAVYLFDKDINGEITLQGGKEYSVNTNIPVSYEKEKRDALKDFGTWKSVARGVGKNKVAHMTSGPLDIDIGRYPIFTFPAFNDGLTLTMPFELEGHPAKLTLGTDEISKGVIDLNEAAKKALGPAGFYKLKGIDFVVNAGGNARMPVERPRLVGEFGLVKKTCERGVAAELIIGKEEHKIENRSGCGRWKKEKDIKPGIYNVTKRDKPGLDSIVMIGRKSVQKKETSPDVVFKKLNPTRYEVSAAVRKGDKLVFGDSYNKGWKFLINGNKYEPIKVNGYANGFMIDDDAKGKACLEYAPQRIYGYSGVISMLAFAGVVAISRKKIREEKRDHEI